jgi:hypothetical protein
MALAYIMHFQGLPVMVDLNHSHPGKILLIKKEREERVQ